MAVFISVVSHGHGRIIRELDCLRKLNEHFNVVVKINKEDTILVDYLSRNDIEYIDRDYGLGFGHNNNVVFSYCKERFDMNCDDFFIVLNPDIVSDVNMINKLVLSMKEKMISLAAVNLFKDSDFKVFDNSIRKFPTLRSFISSFLKLGNLTIVDKALVGQPTTVDWAAGSCLAFKVSHYAILKGFDENYFMYCEDIDICYRSKKLGIPVTFFPDIKMQHLAEHANRKIFSKHFFWHVRSVFRFLMMRRGFTKQKSSLFAISANS
ncbi:glycosyltransferase family 2 protein [Vibrio harveyi]|uniref:glycosyltransferase family 2 protein n=1 Tax=Vibrio harveyi TaxID=669 RepID=UPI00165D5620|nr:glycosyltransferase family 2 protein [Vibrio harveyi]